MPLEINEEFHQTFSLSDAEILDKIYRKPAPNKFLSSFVKFVFSKMENEMISHSVIKSFEQFFDKYICKYEDYENYEIKLSGSVAFRFRDYLVDVASKRNLLICEIKKFPIERLTRFHLEQ